jgi:uncharacterized protein DUF6636
MKAAAMSLTGAACCVWLLACGSGATKTVTVVTRTVTRQQTTPAAGAGTATAATAAPAPVHIGFFRTPTGNIGCAVADGTARCDIRQRDWSPPPRPASCPNIVDFGQGLIVGQSGPGRFVCAGDTALDPGGPPVAYGQVSQVGNFTCASRISGVTCRNTATGHGFQISRQGYEVF